MEGSGRDYLTGSIKLSRSKDGNSPDEYFIESVIGEGGSTVCYEAKRKLTDGTVETGKLKEFYPIDSVIGNKPWYYSLERLPTGQLVPKSGTIRKFDEMCQDYIGTYKLLQKVMVDNPKNEILKNYIQHGEILYCYIEKENSIHAKETSGLIKKKDYEALDTVVHRKPTVYVWSPGFPGKGFNIYLADIKKNPAKNPENKLQDILLVMDALTDCIKAMHTAGLMHLDIKPSNFLVQYDSDFKIKPNHISLFDIDTLCSIDSEFLRVSGTKGYCAPEVVNGRADNRSDIYSIGAMLFYALVATKDNPACLYRDSDYPNINQLVKHSEIFQTSEVNSDARLMTRICKILEKCLARDYRKRYQSCSELKKDIDKARQRLNKIFSSPIEKNKEGLTDPMIVIQKLLYKHPLYVDVPKGVSDVNVLVIGSGTYGQKFIDVSLQAGQMSGIKLNITAVSDEPEEDKESYLRFRPALCEFVYVEGSSSMEENITYANLEFRGVSEKSDEENDKPRFGKNPQVDEEIVKNIIESAVAKNKEYHYVFVALGSDRISRRLARLCSERIRDCYGSIRPVCYVSQKVKKEVECDIDNKLYPAWINEPIDMATIDQYLGEMAFNTHNSWNSTMNFDVAKERQQFFTSELEKDKYNRTSSMSYALSIKYKLHSIHIEGDDSLEAAEQFSKQILERRFTSDDAKKKFEQLVNLEHRRWLIERAVDGWTAPRDDNGKLKLEDCIARGSVKDSTNRTHPCMVQGSESSPLSDPKYIVENHAKWNEGDIDPELDELDRMSIDLHRCFKRQADIFRKESFIQNADIVFIQNKIPNEFENTMREFKQFQFALKNILNGSESYSRQYSYYQEVFKSSLNELPRETSVEIEKRLTVIEHDLFPIIESNLYRNYKANDEILIEKIPYILTYRNVPAIAMTFEDGKYQNGRNEAVFGNVAAASVLRPKKIHFLYTYDKDSSIDLLIHKFDASLNYFGKRKIYCGVELIISCLKKVSNEDRDNLQEELSDLKEKYQQTNGNAWIANYHIFDVDNYEEAAVQFREYLTENPIDLYDGGNQLFPSAYDNALFTGQIIKQDIPYFEFNWRNKAFTKRINCEYLKFVKDTSFIRIQDMFSLMNATDNRFNLPEFADDYENLWKIYTGEYLDYNKFENGVKNWNYLCSCLEKYEANQSPLARLEIRSNKNTTYKWVTYFLPDYSFSTVKKLLERLKDYGIVERESTLVKHASDTCKLEMKINAYYEKKVSCIFMNPQILLPYYGIEVQKYRSYNVDYVVIIHNNLTVTNVNLDHNSSGRQKYAIGVLKQLEKAHFIHQLKQNKDEPKLVSFVYSSPRIKQILNSSGEILEIYAYYETLKTGYFDDVACGYEFCWESGGVKNELDLVLIKGFKSMIVECKAVVELKLDHYHKLHSIADQFGIGTTKILLGNTYSKSNVVADKLNIMQRSRGTQLGITTISNKEEIINIGKTLKQLMETN